MTKLQQIRSEKGLVHKMCKLGHLYLIKSLTNTLIDWNDQHEYQTPLMCAINYKQIDVVKYILKVPQQNFCSHSVRYGSAIHMALRNQEFKTALQIFKKSPSASATVQKDFDGNTPLHILFSNFGQLSNHQYSTQLAKHLTDNSAAVNVYNKHEQTPLHIAVAFGNIKAVKFAIQYN